ncbi:MAG: hypothetical protein NVSMB13_16170 [Mycobacteriales bacterium]
MPNRAEPDTGPPVEVELSTPSGPARVHLHAPRDGPSTVLLVLGHGAGGGVGAPDLVALARALPARHVSVALVEQPYRVAGRRAPAPAGVLDLALCAVVAGLRARPELAGVPLVSGGRSSGARVACRTSTAVGANGVLCLAFPLSAPGRPGRSRAGELLTPPAPLLVVQGSRDGFGTGADVTAALGGRPGTRVHEVAGADHALAVRRVDGRSAADVRAELVTVVASWLAGLAGAGRGMPNARSGVVVPRQAPRQTPPHRGMEVS